MKFHHNQLLYLYRGGYPVARFNAADTGALQIALGGAGIDSGLLRVNQLDHSASSRLRVVVMPIRLIGE